MSDNKSKQSKKGFRLPWKKSNEKKKEKPTPADPPAEQPPKRPDLSKYRQTVYGNPDPAARIFAEESLRNHRHSTNDGSLAANVFKQEYKSRFEDTHMELRPNSLPPKGSAAAAIPNRRTQSNSGDGVPPTLPTRQYRKSPNSKERLVYDAQEAIYEPPDGFTVDNGTKATFPLGRRPPPPPPSPSRRYNTSSLASAINEVNSSNNEINPPVSGGGKKTKSKRVKKTKSKRVKKSKSKRAKKSKSKRVKKSKSKRAKKTKSRKSRK